MTSKPGHPEDKSRAVAQEALRRARENEIQDPGLAAAIMKAALRTIAGEDYG